MIEEIHFIEAIENLLNLLTYDKQKIKLKESTNGNCLSYLK